MMLPTCSHRDPQPPAASPLPCAVVQPVIVTSNVTIDVTLTFLPFPSDPGIGMKAAPRFQGNSVLSGDRAR